MSQEDNTIFDLDPEVSTNFYKNLDKVYHDIEVERMEITSSHVSSQNSDGDVTEDKTYENSTEMELTEGVDDALTDINLSLAQQICEELENMAATKNKKKKLNKTKKIQIGVLAGLLSLVLLAGFLGFTKPGNKLLVKMGVDLGGKIWAVWTDSFEKNPTQKVDTDYLEQEDLESDAKEIDPDTILWPDHPGDGRKEEGVYNILLLGEEAIGSGSSRGRTDLIIIATLNTVTKEIKLTSLMRDTLVKIPGYNDNKLNSAYEKGGLDLLYETIATNFDIRLDGCAMVNFTNFEKIIDKLDGLEIELTASEARYLNNTNYISNPQYRNVKEGMNQMNGNQVLGYSRVRKRATINGVNNDYGRTERHRIILEAVFDKYKTESKVELAGIMFSLLPMVTTDISSEHFEVLLNSFIEMGTLKMEQLRLPIDGSFTDNVKVRGMDVLVPNWNTNISAFHEFVFGDNNSSTAE